MSDDLTDVIATLTQRRNKHRASAALLDEAILSLSRLGPAEMPRVLVAPVPDPPKHLIPEGTEGRSVYETVLALASEGPRDWSADEIMRETERRGTPFTVKAPKNAVFSALSRAHRRGELMRTGHGTYRHPKFVDQWTAGDDGSSPHEIEFSIHPIGDGEGGENS